MGKFEARLPGDLRYSDNHLWLQDQGHACRVGFTAYSVRLLQDVYFLDWTVDPGTPVVRRQSIGEIESSKALSTLYAPCEGRILAFNEQLLNDPTAINTDNYGEGWLFELETAATLLSPAEYLELLERTWEDTQRIIKGQMN